MHNNDIHLFPDVDALSAAAAQRCAALAHEAIARHGQFHIALSGGSTPRHLFESMANASFLDKFPWQHTHVYFGDERCVPPDHPDSNFRMAYEALLKFAPLPETHVHRMKGELPDAVAAARNYEDILATHLPRNESDAVVFDLVLLGLGPDGHIASLFPGTEALRETQRQVVAVYVDKLQAWRISITLPVINNARHIMMLVSGEAKADIMGRLYHDSGAAPLPVQMIRPAGTREWYLDQAAAQQLVHR